MRHSLRFLWNATKGHRLAPWRSPYLLWRIETYCGVKMTQIGFLEFLGISMARAHQPLALSEVDRRDGPLHSPQAEEFIATKRLCPRLQPRPG